MNLYQPKTIREPEYVNEFDRLISIKINKLVMNPKFLKFKKKSAINTC